MLLISQDVIDNIENSSNVKECIMYLRTLDINNIDELLITNIEPFCASVDLMKEVVNKIGENEIKNLLESDVDNVYLLYAF